MKKWLFLSVVWMVAMTINVHAKGGFEKTCQQPPTFAESSSYIFGEGEIWPWPWGTECPFNWRGIEGSWALVDGPMLDTFKITVLSESNIGSRYYSVEQYDVSGELVAEGSGYAQKGERIIRAAVYDLPGSNNDITSEPSSGYWVIVRFYRDPRALSCQASQVTALTLRSFNDCEKPDHHYLVEKIRKSKKGDQ